ncbi:UNVERIFIED_CONTAM: Zinc finger protein BRUTUS-like [Sesamum radiatum]|uniref:Zinc finger protein BRUTUS-like n=1 Tax=Sesamum radiatum TaxID=300843 RepID=A0AAW2PJP3_SESRA
MIGGGGGGGGGASFDGRRRTREGGGVAGDLDCWVRLVDAPVLFFVATHKLSGLSLLRSARRRRQRPMGFVEVKSWLTLGGDALVKNVVSTYSLEHKTIDDNFSSIFHHLDMLMKRDEDAPQMFQELLFSIGSIQSMICQHMQKEEEQVFPLVKQKFTSEQQSQLVWQYMCSVPVVLLEEFLPWMTLYLTSDEKLDVLGCIKLITPKERILQEQLLGQIFYPLLRQFSNKDLSSCSPLIDESQIKNLRELLFYEAQGPDQNRRSFIEMLCQELESLEKWFSKNLILLETEVFPFISESCASEMQLGFLYTSLHMMPLGLLRCTVTWFSSHLTENQSNSILKNMKLGCPSISKPFISLLHEWVRIGCSGKTSVDKFRQNLEDMFKGRCFYLTKQNRQDIVFCYELPGVNSTIKMRESMDIPSSSVSVATEERDMSYPTEMNLHIFFSQMFKRMPPLQKNLAESDDAFSVNLESRPMDLIFYIHRALIKDLENLVILSAKLAANVGFLTEFKNRFKLLHNIYQVHSISEDEIAFPALESKGAHKNISHSYCIDHKLEAKHFRRTSIILDEISELNDHEGCNKTTLKYYHLCLKLHETCLSMHKHAVMSLWLRIARYTKFDEWLGEWWEGMTRYNTSTVEDGSRSPSLAADPIEVVSMYLMKDDAKIKKVRHDRGTPKEFSSSDCNYSGSCTVDESVLPCGSHDGCQSQDLSQYQSEVDKKRSNEANDKCCECQKLSHHEHPLGMNQEELEATIRRISRDSNLDCQRKSYIIQNLLMSRWIIKQKMSHQEASMENHKGEIPGKNPSYKDPLESTFGCKHYKRNCKLLAPCCNKLYTCIRCHDDQADHSVDREKCLEDNCPICHEYIFTSNSPVKALPCGHLMHSACFQDYTCSHYTCPICSKSLGNMQLTI